MPCGNGLQVIAVIETSPKATLSPSFENCSRNLEEQARERTTRFLSQERGNISP
jgi:hypothetical protein